MTSFLFFRIKVDGNYISSLFPKLSEFLFWIYCEYMDIQNSTRFIDYMTCKRKKKKFDIMSCGPIYIYVCVEIKK